MLTRTQANLGGSLDWRIEDTEGRCLRHGFLTDGRPYPVNLPIGPYRLVSEESGGEPASRLVQLGAGVQPIDL